jgi:hypothetical protein
LFVLVSTTNGQDASGLEREFETAAKAQWRRLREQMYSDQHVVIDWTMVRKGDPHQKDMDEQGQIKRFADGPDRLSVSIRKAPENGVQAAQDIIHVLGGNMNYLFHIERGANREWIVSDVILGGTGALQPTFDVPDVRVRGNGDTQTFLLQSAFDDDRLWVDQETLESFIHSKKNWITSFSERPDEDYGRVVIVSLNHRSPRSPQSGVHITVAGQLELLADHQWVLLGYNIKYTRFDQNGTEVSQSERSMHAHYDASLETLTRCVRKTVSTDGFEMTETRDRRPMTMEETAEAVARCSLAGFGLPEPD